VTLAAALLIAVAVWLAVSPSADPRLDSLLPRPPTRSTFVPGRVTVTWVATAMAATGLLVTLPSPGNALACFVSLVVVPRFVGRMESRSERRRREALARQGPVVADLLAATLSSGAPMRSALAAVGGALTEPARGNLLAVVSALDLGADPVEAWAVLADDDVLGAVAGAVVRSARTGAPLSSLLSRLADDMRRDRRAMVEVAARTAGVRAVVPLAACFLPAFILLGVVPVVAALAGQLLSP